MADITLESKYGTAKQSALTANPALPGLNDPDGTPAPGMFPYSLLRSHGPENAQVGTTYTLVLADSYGWVSCTNAAAITLTVPPNSSVAFPIGTVIPVLQGGAGQVTFAQGAGVTINSVGGALAMIGQHSLCWLKKTATDTWVLSGDLVVGSTIASLSNTTDLFNSLSVPLSEGTKAPVGIADNNLLGVDDAAAASGELAQFTANGVAGLAISANVSAVLGAADYAAIRALLDLEAGTDFYSISAADAAFAAIGHNHSGVYEPVDADILRADTADVLTAGFATTAYNAGTKSTGTFTPDEANGNFQYAVNGGAHTLAPPTNNCSIVVHYTNNGSAGAITTSGFTITTGDTPTTTDTHEQLWYINKVNDVSHLHIVNLQ